MNDRAEVPRGRGLRHRGESGSDARRDAAATAPSGPIVAPPSPEPGPVNERWRALLAEGGPILADGAMGTMLFGAGLQFGDPPEAWNVSNSEVVRRIHRGYLDAGSRIVMTNTFGGNRLRLRLHGLDPRVTELNRTAAILVRAEVDAAGGNALVAGGVDLIWIETMSHLSEIGAAIRGVRRASAGIPIIATMTFDTRGFTMMGVSPEQAARSLIEAGADAIGGNCGNGPDELLPVIAKMHAVAPDAILVAKSNAGMPELIDMRAVYRADPSTMAEAGLGFRAAGAWIIGACCGSTPAHLAAMAEALGVDR